MKYLKLFENKDVDELSELVPTLEDLCQDLKDHGFKVDINCIYTNVYDFSDGDIKLSIKSSDINIVKAISISIGKYGRDFYINDIEDDLLFIESYTVGELDLKVNYYLGFDISSFNDKSDNDAYYKNIKNLPKDKKIEKIIICFIRA